jgi:hypothetical protein
MILSKKSATRGLFHREWYDTTRDLPEFGALKLERRLGIARKTLRPRLVKRLERRYDAILAAGLAFPPSRGQAFSGSCGRCSVRT